MGSLPFAGQGFSAPQGGPPLPQAGPGGPPGQEQMDPDMLMILFNLVKALQGNSPFASGGIPQPPGEDALSQPPPQGYPFATPGTGIPQGPFNPFASGGPPR